MTEDDTHLIENYLQYCTLLVPAAQNLIVLRNSPPVAGLFGLASEMFKNRDTAEHGLNTTYGAQFTQISANIARALSQMYTMEKTLYHAQEALFIITRHPDMNKEGLEDVIKNYSDASNTILADIQHRDAYLRFRQGVERKAGHLAQYPFSFDQAAGQKVIADILAECEIEKGDMVQSIACCEEFIMNTMEAMASMYVQDGLHLLTRARLATAVCDGRGERDPVLLEAIDTDIRMAQKSVQHARHMYPITNDGFIPEMPKLTKDAPRTSVPSVPFKPKI